MQILVGIVCAALLVALICAFIFNDKFRKDVLVGEGEARIFGVITVKGIAIIVLSGLFLGGLIYSTRDKTNLQGQDIPTEENNLNVNEGVNDNIQSQMSPHEEDDQKVSEKANNLPSQKSQHQLDTQKLRNTIWKRICENCTRVITYLHLRSDGVFGRNFDEPDNFEYTGENDHWRFNRGYLIMEWNNGKTIGEYDLSKIRNDYHPGTIFPEKKGPVRLMRVR